MKGPRPCPYSSSKRACPPTSPGAQRWRPKSESEAMEKFIEGDYDGEEEGPLFGDAIDSLPVLRTARVRDDKPP